MKRLALILLGLLASGPVFGQVVPAPTGTAAMVCANNTVVPSPTNGKFFYVQCDASGKLITNASTSNKPPVVFIDTTPGTGKTYTTPANTSYIIIELQAGGGGGANATAAASQTNIGGSGGCGGLVIHMISSPAASYSYDIPSGGAAQTAASDATFGGILTAGGGGGSSSATGSGTTLARSGSPGTGGSATGGNISNIPGAWGNFALRYSGTEAISPVGCNSPSGGAGGVSAVNGNGIAGNLGGGGSGAASTDTTARTGGAGGGPRLIVYAYPN